MKNYRNTKFKTFYIAQLCDCAAWSLTSFTSCVGLKFLLLRSWKNECIANCLYHWQDTFVIFSTATKIFSNSRIHKEDDSCSYFSIDLLHSLPPSKPR